MAGGCLCEDNSQCVSEKGLFCNFNPGGAVTGSGCIGSSPTGQCTPMPTSCSQIQSPVCGCDGNTYGNGCIASQAGVNIAISTGACPAGVGPADGGP